MEISVVQGDITAQQVDAVVNAANRAMRGGGGVDSSSSMWVTAFRKPVPGAGRGCRPQRNLSVRKPTDGTNGGLAPIGGQDTASEAIHRGCNIHAMAPSWKASATMANPKNTPSVLNSV